VGGGEVRAYRIEGAAILDRFTLPRHCNCAIFEDCTCPEIDRVKMMFVVPLTSGTGTTVPAWDGTQK
jgi:hypothetical protein